MILIRVDNERNTWLYQQLLYLFGSLHFSILLLLNCRNTTQILNLHLELGTCSCKKDITKLYKKLKFSKNSRNTLEGE